MKVVVTGAGLAVPGADSVELLRRAGPGSGPVDPAAVLGRRGLLYKDGATQLALCAARGALADAGLLAADELTVPGDEVAVVASSNLGNLDTVCRAAATIEASGVGAVSPMDLPNASSNVVASSVAIRFGLRGPNLMLCNGATGGLDAVSFAVGLVRAGRAARAVVVGVEPSNEIARQLTGCERLLDGAVALVVEAASAARARGARQLAAIGGYARAADVVGCVDRLVDGGPAPGIWFVSEEADATPSPPALADVPHCDLSAIHGRSSGALGVLQCAAALAWLADGTVRRALLTVGGARGEAAAALVLDAAGATP